MLWVLGAVGALVGLVALLATVGAFVPRRHVATCAVRLRAKPQEAWDVVSDFAAWPSWAPDVRAMDRLPDRDGRAAWRMSSRQGAIATEVLVWTPPERIVTRICDDSLPFGGSWSWEIEATPEGSRVAITEDGEIKNLVFRAMARFLFGYHATQDKFLRALAARLGETATVERVR
jgi:hypothetical protein